MKKCFYFRPNIIIRLVNLFYWKYRDKYDDIKTPNHGRCCVCGEPVRTTNPAWTSNETGRMPLHKPECANVWFSWDLPWLR